VLVSTEVMGGRDRPGGGGKPGGANGIATPTGPGLPCALPRCSMHTFNHSHEKKREKLPKEGETLSWEVVGLGFLARLLGFSSGNGTSDLSFVSTH
jgi:hypothetical protein